jgi:hypothetical protein
VLRKVHGDETALWMRRWRWFLLATSGLFGYAGGSEWGVSHLPAEGGRLRPMFTDSCRMPRAPSSAKPQFPVVCPRSKRKRCDGTGAHNRVTREKQALIQRDSVV